MGLITRDSEEAMSSPTAQQGERVGRIEVSVVPKSRKMNECSIEVLVVDRGLVATRLRSPTSGKVVVGRPTVCRYCGERTTHHWQKLG